MQRVRRLHKCNKLIAKGVSGEVCKYLIFTIPEFTVDFLSWDLDDSKSGQLRNKSDLIFPYTKEDFIKVYSDSNYAV